MDEPRHPNWPIIIALVMGVPNWLMLALMVWFRAHPESASEADMIGQGGPLMTGWLPVAVVSATSALSAIMLAVVAFRRWRNKQLRTERLELEKELGIARKKARDAAEDAKEARREKIQAEGSLQAVEADRDEVLSRLANANSQLEDQAFLRRMAEEQAKNIADHVMVRPMIEPHPGELVLSGTRLLITVGFQVTNESVFDITIKSKDVSGQFSLDNVLFTEPAGLLIDDFRGPIENLRHRQKGSLILKQPLRGFEAEIITKCLEKGGGAKFWIGNLSILISVSNTAFQVEPKPLKITAETEGIPLNKFKRNTNNA